MRKFAWLVVVLFGSPVAASDFNKDGTVTFEDFLLFAQRYGTSAGDVLYAPEFDLDNSGQVDLVDFRLFADTIGRSSPAAKATAEDTIKARLEKLAKEAWGAKDYSETARRYREYLRQVTKDEDKAHGLKSLATSLIAMGSLDEAKVPLKKMIEDYKDTDNKVIKTKLSKGSALLGYIYFEQKNVSKAFQYWGDIRKYTSFAKKGE